MKSQLRTTANGAEAVIATPDCSMAAFGPKFFKTGQSAIGPMVDLTVLIFQSFAFHPVVTSQQG